MEWTQGAYVLTDDPARLDVDAVCRLLSDTYWAAGRPRHIVERTIAHSLCLGLFHGDEQIGFCRAVSDFATFTWIADVIVHPAHRGKGLGKWMMKCLLEHPRLRDGKQVLRTRDAHKLYEQFGFERTEFMLRKPPGEF